MQIDSELLNFGLLEILKFELQYRPTIEYVMYLISLRCYCLTCVGEGQIVNG